MSGNNSSYGRLPLVHAFPIETELSTFANDANKWFLLHIFPVIFGIGSGFNLLIITYFIKYNVQKKRKLVNMSSYHFLIINQAITDLLITASTAIFYPRYYIPPWDLGEFLCVFIGNYTTNMCPMVSCWILVLISIVRYNCIMNPFKPGLNKRKSALICLLFWIVPAVPFWYHLNVILRHNKDGAFTCTYDIEMDDYLPRAGIQYLIDSFIPLFIMVALYRKMSKKMNTEDLVTVFPLHQLSRERNRTALRTIRGLIFVFGVTVIPVRFVDILRWGLYIYADKFRPPFYTVLKSFRLIVYPLVLTTFYLNNMLNILIYAKMMPRFRHFLWNLFTLGRYGRVDKG